MNKHYYLYECDIVLEGIPESVENMYFIVGFDYALVARKEFNNIRSLLNEMVRETVKTSAIVSDSLTYVTDTEASQICAIPLESTTSIPMPKVAQGLLQYRGMETIQKAIKYTTDVPIQEDEDNG
jgi:hypothetical protein